MSPSSQLDAGPGFSPKKGNKKLHPLKVKGCPSISWCTFFFFAFVLNITMRKSIASIIVTQVPSVWNLFYHPKIIAMITVNQWYTSARYFRSTSDIPLCATQRWAVNTQERQAVYLLVNLILFVTCEVHIAYSVECGASRRAVSDTLTSSSLDETWHSHVLLLLLFLQSGLPLKRQLLVFTGCSFMHAPGEQVTKPILRGV